MMNMRRFASAAAALALFVPLQTRGQVVEVDYQKSAGAIRPLHGVNGGPLCYRGTVDLTRYHRELRIPNTRLHDVPWVNAEAVDLHLLFPDMRADPARPENYRFAATDDYIAAITNVPSQIVFRLGESIEHTPRQYFVHPPSDPAKWAAVCVNVIRHYNDGWASGFRHGIRYWEIWNEPENRPVMWTGTDEQFFELYAAAATAVKAAFPELKAGGPGLGATGEFDGDKFKPTTFLGKFLSYCRDRHLPLDFFSWHRYTSHPGDLQQRAQALRRLLDEHGFTRTESHLNEWNYLPNDDWRPLLREGQGQLREQWFEQMSGAAGAAFAASGLILLQDAAVDMANFYTGEVQGFGLFNYHGVPKKSYYAFKAFADMLDTPARVEARAERDGQLALLAGTDAKLTRAAVLVSSLAGLNSADKRTAAENKPSSIVTVRFVSRPWPGPIAYELRVVDDTHDLTVVRKASLGANESSVSFELQCPAVALIKLLRK
jgi:xylan 1,4-beta-xylosidase